MGLLVLSDRDHSSLKIAQQVANIIGSTRISVGRREYVFDYITGVRDHLSFFQCMSTFVEFAYFIDERDDLIMDLHNSAD